MAIILVVDDEEHIRLLYSEELKEEGYDVITAEGGHRLLERIEQEKPDLVVLDIKMVDYNGLDLLQDIRNNFYKPFISDVYFRYLVNSLIIAVGNVALVVPVALLAAYAFSRFRIRNDRDLFFWTLTNRMAPPAVFIIPYYLIYSTLGIIDTYFGMIIMYSIKK